MTVTGLGRYRLGIPVGTTALSRLTDKKQKSLERALLWPVFPPFSEKKVVTPKDSEVQWRVIHSKVQQIGGKWKGGFNRL